MEETTTGWSVVTKRRQVDQINIEYEQEKEWTITSVMFRPVPSRLSHNTYRVRDMGCHLLQRDHNVPAIRLDDYIWARLDENGTAEVTARYFPEDGM